MIGESVQRVEFGHGFELEMKNGRVQIKDDDERRLLRVRYLQRRPVRFHDRVVAADYPLRRTSDDQRAGRTGFPVTRIACPYRP